jgi:DNA-binding transcriptional LysR family regulator
MFGMRVVAPLIPAFQARYPELRVELRLAEHPARLTEDDVDIDLRLGMPPDGQLMQRLLLRSARVLVASPGYLARQAPVRAPRDLQIQDCLTYWVGRDDATWRFLARGELQELPIAARFTSNNGEVLRQLALAGHGIALLDDYTVRDELAAGRLVRLLPDWQVTNSDFEPGIYAVFRQATLLPAKTRAFLDFMVESLSRTTGGT